MEKLDVFDCSNVLIASYFSDDRGCAHENREHTLIYLCSGRLEIDDKGSKTAKVCRGRQALPFGGVEVLAAVPARVLQQARP